MFCIDFEDFPNNPLSFGFNFFWQKTLFSRVFEFLGATGLKMELGQWEELDNFIRTNKLK
jgi:hypothetical protein